MEQMSPAGVVVGQQSVQLNCPTQSVELSTKLSPPKVMLEVEERLGAERQTHRIPFAYSSLMSTVPVREALVSLLRISTRQSLPRSSPQALMFWEVPAVTVVQQMKGWSRMAQMAKSAPQQSAEGLKPGACPQKDWLDAPMGLQKLMKQPEMMANSMLMSMAHSAAAKLLVTPSMPESLVSLMSLMPTRYQQVSTGVPVSSTKRFLRNCLEQVSLRRLGMVAWEALRKTMQRKVKTTQQLQVMFLSCATHEVLASCVMPGPEMQMPKLFWMVEMSLMKLVTVQVRLQMLAARSPQSSSSRLMQLVAKMLKNALKFLQQLEVVVKLLFSRSHPRSTAQVLVKLQKQLLSCETTLALAARSRVQVTLAPQRTEEQLYLYPLGTCTMWQKALKAEESNCENLVRERKTGLLRQGMISSRYIDTPTVFQQGQVVQMVPCVKSMCEMVCALQASSTIRSSKRQRK